MPLLPQFDTPAHVRDVPVGSPFYAAWSTWISGQIAGTRPGDNGGAYYDPTVTNVNIAGEKSLTWMGFPRDTILPANRDDATPAYIAADSNVATRSDLIPVFLIASDAKDLTPRHLNGRFGIGIWSLD